MTERVAKHDVEWLESGPIVAQRLPEDQELFDDPAAHQMLLDNTLERVRPAAVVPGSFRVDDGDRTGLAYPQAIGLGPVNASLLREPHLFQAAFEKIPGLE
jgi:hypothetical protein